MSKVSHELSLKVGAEVSLTDLSLSQLIQATKELFDREGVPGFVKFLVELIERQIVKDQRKCPHCGSGLLHFHSRVGRSVKSSIGEIHFKLSRYRCQSCGKTSIPVRKVLDLDAFSRKSRELEKLALQTVTDQSFRRSAKNLKDTLGLKAAASTLHRWFSNSDKDFGDLTIPRQIDFIIADGTGFRKLKDEKGSNRGEVRVVVGLDKDGKAIPFGAWTKASWKTIGKLLKTKYNPSSKLKLKPLATTLISYGEDEIEHHPQPHWSRCPEAFSLTHPEASELTQGWASLLTHPWAGGSIRRGASEQHKL
jgi:transposase-like protein